MKGVVLGASLHAGAAQAFQVECLVAPGLPRVQIVGLPDQAAREACERLPAAFARHQLRFPKSRVLFNLAPAQLPKRGFPVDLALACALLLATGQFPAPPANLLLALAELDLAGQLRPPARGTLLAAALAQRRSATLLVSPDARPEAELVSGVACRSPRDLHELVRGLDSLPPPSASAGGRPGTTSTIRLDQVRGQAQARQAATLAAAGRLSLLLQGPPGTGKTMLARRLAALLPPLPSARALELAGLESLHGPVRRLPTQPPFRAPHHSISAQALLGGGRPLRPGEASRAHGGVLFLDELPEFPRPALEGLRQPLEERELRLERTGESACFPADFLLVAARNPCPCGYATHPTRPCRCTPAVRARYERRTSGPLLDRFDLFVEMGPVPAEALQQPATPPRDEEIHAQLQRAHRHQADRRRKLGWSCPGRADRAALEAAGLTRHAQHQLARAADRWQWSGRGVLRCLRVARTLADLEARPAVHRRDILRAVGFRPQATRTEDLIVPPKGTRA